MGFPGTWSDEHLASIRRRFQTSVGPRKKPIRRGEVGRAFWKHDDLVTVAGTPCGQFGLRTGQLVQLILNVIQVGLVDRGEDQSTGAGSQRPERDDIQTTQGWRTVFATNGIAHYDHSMLLRGGGGHFRSPGTNQSRLLADLKFIESTPETGEGERSVRIGHGFGHVLSAAANQNGGTVEGLAFGGDEHAGESAVGGQRDVIVGLANRSSTSDSGHEDSAAGKHDCGTRQATNDVHVSSFSVFRPIVLTRMQHRPMTATSITRDACRKRKLFPHETVFWMGGSGRCEGGWESVARNPLKGPEF